MPDASPVVPVATPATANAPAVVVPAPKAEPVVPPPTPAAPPTPVAVDYKLKLPDGSQVAPEYVDQVVSFAKENKLSNEQAQAILNRDSGSVSSFVEAQKAQLTKNAEAWKNAVVADPEIGGDNYKKNVDLAVSVMKRFGTPELSKVLEETQFGNHPEVIRALARIGKAMTPDQLVLPGQQPPGKKAIEDVFYPASKQQ